MKKPGTITLYNDSGTRLSFYRYTNGSGRRAILNYWKGLYGERFKMFHYHIEPDYEETEIKKVA